MAPAPVVQHFHASEHSFAHTLPKKRYLKKKNQFNFKDMYRKYSTHKLWQCTASQLIKSQHWNNIYQLQVSVNPMPQDNPSMTVSPHRAPEVQSLGSHRPFGEVTRPDASPTLSFLLLLLLLPLKRSVWGRWWCSEVSASPQDYPMFPKDREGEM